MIADRNEVPTLTGRSLNSARMQLELFGLQKCCERERGFQSTMVKVNAHQNHQVPSRMVCPISMMSASNAKQVALSIKSLCFEGTSPLRGRREDVFPGTS